MSYDASFSRQYLALRQPSTFFLIDSMNLSGTPGLELKPHAGSDRAFTYFTPDWSEDPETGVVEQKNELFAFRFANAESKCSLDTFHFGDVSRKSGSLLQALRLQRVNVCASLCSGF